MKKLINWFKSFFAKRCAHRFDSKKVTDFNIESKDIECLLCGKKFGVINSKKTMQFHYLPFEKLHTVIEIK
jgi:hypothetical protein